MKRNTSVQLMRITGAQNSVFKCEPLTLGWLWAASMYRLYSFPQVLTYRPPIFQCNKKRILDYPNLWGFTKDVYQTDGIAATVNFEHIKKLYQVHVFKKN